MKNLTVKEAYDKVAASYDGSYQDPISLIEDCIILRKLNTIIQPSDLVVDLGSGTGFYLDKSPRPTLNYIGVDCSTEMLQIARLKHPRNNFVENYMEDMADIKPSSIDVVISLFGSISYAEPLRTAMEIDRITHKGSRIFLMYYGKGYPDRETYILKRHNITAPIHEVNDYLMLYPKFAFTVIPFMAKKMVDDKKRTWTQLNDMFEMYQQNLKAEDSFWVIVEGTKLA